MRQAAQQAILRFVLPFLCGSDVSSFPVSFCKAPFSADNEAKSKNCMNYMGSLIDEKFA